MQKGEIEYHFVSILDLVGLIKSGGAVSTFIIDVPILSLSHNISGTPSIVQLSCVGRYRGHAFQLQYSR